MKLLFDENLPPQLLPALVGLFLGSTHVRDLGLKRAADSEIWSRARDAGFTIVSKDWDFQQLSFLTWLPTEGGLGSARELLDLGPRAASPSERGEHHAIWGRRGGRSSHPVLTNTQQRVAEQVRELDSGFVERAVPHHMAPPQLVRAMCAWD